MAQLRVRAHFPNGGFGFDGQARRYDGDVFSIDEAKFQAKWMTPLKPGEAEKAESGNDEVAVAEQAPVSKAKPKAKAKAKAKTKARARADAGVHS